MTIYILVYFYTAHARENICGVTPDYDTAMVWYKANHRTDVYAVTAGSPLAWDQEVRSWRHYDRFRGDKK